MLDPLKLTLEHLILGPAEYDAEVLITHWGFRLPPGFVGLFPTVLGHLFYEASDKSIQMLDTWSGELNIACDSYEDLKLACAESADFRMNWLFADLVAGILDSGAKRAQGFCFNPFANPALGGSLAPDNFGSCTLRVHLATSAAEFKATRSSA